MEGRVNIWTKILSYLYIYIYYINRICDRKLELAALNHWVT